MPPKLPIAVDDILQALKSPECNNCQGMGRWRTKKRCTTCNGKGTTAEIMEICTVCKGRGQLPDRSVRRVECSLCRGFGVVYQECWECKHTGFVEEGDEYCDVCRGAGEVPLAGKVAEAADPKYIRHLVQKLEEYAEKGSQVDLTKACAIDALLHNALKHAYQITPRRDRDLFSEEIRVAFGIARMKLGQKMRQCEEESQRKKLQARAEYAQALALIRSRVQETKHDLNSEYWHGLGYGWDALS